MASAAAAITKKTVTRQQLYGSNRCLRQSSVHYPLDHGTLQTAHAGGVGNTLKRQTCALSHSRSITALQNMDLYGSYATLPSTAGGAAAPLDTPQRSYCARHLPSGVSAAAAVGAGGGGVGLGVGVSDSHTWHSNQYAAATPCCHLYNANQAAAAAAPTCMYGGVGAGHTCQQQQPQSHQQQQQYPRATLLHDSHKPLVPNGCYFGYEHGTHLTDEEDSAFPGFHDREFHMLHRNIPALRRTGVDTAGIRQYFYPDGGWGWIICGIAFLVHILTTGLQLSSGLLLFYAIEHLRDSNGIEWVGALNWSISMLLSPFVITFCRKKSTRLMAVVGGLVLPLGVLFTSFATELGQIFFSYGIVFGVAVAMVRESSTIMLGNYFKRRRQFVEMIAMSGEGVGISIFSVILREGVGNAGWRVGLQIVAGLVAVSFFMGLLYRPASLYHPQRRAIQHLKNQRKKMRENKSKSVVTTEQRSVRYLFLDISPFKSTNVKILLVSAAVAALGIYTPMISMTLTVAKEGPDIEDLVLLQTFLGVSTTMGVFIAGTILRKTFRIGSFLITSQIVSQVFIALIAIAILSLSFVVSFRWFCILGWLYGIGFGGFRYAFKVLALDRIKVKQFSKSWGLIKGVESIPVLISIPLTSFLNDYSLHYGRAGYFICSAAAAIGGIIIFFMTYSTVEQSSSSHQVNSKKHGNGAIPTLRPFPQYCKLHGFHEPVVDFNVYNGCDYPAPDLLMSRSCVSLNQVDFENLCRNNAYCDRWHMPSLHKLQHCMVHGGASARGRGGHMGEISRPHSPHYDMEHRYASMGRGMGKRLQKSLSFIQNPYCCNGQWYCNCHDSYQWAQTSPRSQMHQPLLCTCNQGSTNYLQNSRSRSVPEGLSTIGNQLCRCKTTTAGAASGVGSSTALSREVIYLPRHDLDYDFACRHHQRGVGAAATTAAAAAAAAIQHGAATTPRYRHRRSQSLSKPLQYVEQITTSV
ncbi:uncharacterized protein LOC128863195 [Anastrepha ludens]|uniref:uncharacterized protein LOC128863195 n=1 Tax=Anastrepha ludens TaxID=28586 RepID=UPI0023AF6ACB|nr:uncharacterized protein LOC128863195 [Anastrepha ludens]XP_053958189.1 uncharacterized protein LOC128863195 [Anastrepha ludens]XP_053958190.1 uncharacterized protein LOC128863195 [Anastrepha ludens]XP_053958191.1 uncharacterized protein LOC128863195 [Anastrepha ludens]